jgi:hypothetical protein
MNAQLAVSRGWRGDEPLPQEAKERLYAVLVSIAKRRYGMDYVWVEDTHDPTNATPPIQLGQ